MKYLPRKKAEIYIGVIIAVAIFLILSQAIVSLVFSAYDLVVFTRSRTTARFIAEEKIETVRTMDYDDVGTVGGIPAGIIEPTEVIVRNSLPYTINTRIDNIDDAYDGSGAADNNPVDYKRIQVEVRWGGEGTLSRANSINVMTDISSQNDIAQGGGILDITVTDSNGAPVPLAEIHIEAPSLVPPVDTTLIADINGNLVVPGSEACTTCYQISATKTGFSTDRTYGAPDVVNPINPHVTVVDNQISNVNLSIDQTGSLTINSTNSRELGFTPLANQQFILRGEKIIGTDETGTLIYKYAEVVTTNGSGTLALANMEWDAYHIFIPTGVGWDVSGVNPLEPIILNPGGSVTADFSSNTGSANRLLVTFQDGTLTPLASVSATLKRNTGGFEETLTSGEFGFPDFGQAFFDNLSAATYTLYATASGYLNYENTDVVVSDYAKQQVIFIEE